MLFRGAARYYLSLRGAARQTAGSTARVLPYIILSPIMEIFASHKPNKRCLAVYNNKKYHFGSTNGFTFIDGASEKTRDNYRARHYANAAERFRIDNLIPSPALFSWFLLWNTPDIKANIEILNALLEQK